MSHLLQQQRVQSLQQLVPLQLQPPHFVFQPIFPRFCSSSHSSFGIPLLRRLFGGGGGGCDVDARALCGGGSSTLAFAQFERESGSVVFEALGFDFAGAGAGAFALGCGWGGGLKHARKNENLLKLGLWKEEGGGVHLTRVRGEARGALQIVPHQHLMTQAPHRRMHTIPTLPSLLPTATGARICKV
jgi:hypothetical protein